MKEELNTYNSGRPHEIVARQLDEAFLEDTTYKKAPGKTSPALKLDLRKCFDTVVPNQAVQVFRRLGAPPAVCDLLDTFYALQRRWVGLEWTRARWRFFAVMFLSAGKCRQ